MEWTAANVRPEMWPAAFGLGNELQWYLPASQWAHDAVTMYASRALQFHPDGGQFDFVWLSRTYAPWGVRVVSQTKSRKIPTHNTLPLFSVRRYDLVREIFTPASSHPDQIPSTFGPCNSGLMAEWSTDFLNNVTALDPRAMDVFTFHGYVQCGRNGTAGTDRARVWVSLVSFGSPHVSTRPRGTCRHCACGANPTKPTWLPPTVPVTVTLGSHQNARTAFARYQHGSPSVESVASMNGSAVDASRASNYSSREQ